MVDDLRCLNDAEKGAISAMIGKISDKWRASLLDQLNKAFVHPINSDGSILEFIHKGYKRPDQSQMPVGMEGRMLDDDGVEIEVILYWDRNRRLCEFELLRIGFGNVKSPQWKTFHLVGE